MEFYMEDADRLLTFSRLREQPALLTADAPLEE
jgi:hypothetical protein